MSSRFTSPTSPSVRRTGSAWRKAVCLKIRFAARGESLVERGGEHRHGHGFVNRRLDGPAPFAGVRNPPGESSSSGPWQGGCSQVQQPRGDHAAAPPHFRDVTQIEVVLVVLGIAQGSRLGVDLMRVLADIGRADDSQSFRISRHHAILDAVMHHFDEVAAAIGPAVQIALFSGPMLAGRPGVRRCCPCPAPVY